MQATADTLRFDANAPQLTFVQIKPVKAYPEPLAEALNARLAYDDNHTARVFSPIAGRVLSISTEMGKQVQAGDPLLVLDSPDFAQAVADSAKAEADLVRKKNDYERAKQLLEINGIARKDVEAAEADLHQAEAEVRRARAHMRNLSSNALTPQGEFILRAPIGGIVSERQVNAGSEVRPDATNPLFVITNARRLWLMVDLPERQLGKLAVGQPVSVEVDAYPDETFSGKVSVIGEALDPVTRRIQVRCEVDNSQQKLKPEMFARVTPVAGGGSDLPRIPNSALVTQGLYSYLFVEQSPGVLQRRRVMLGTQDSEYSYVKEGLRAGERVVTSGALLLNSELAGNE
jgi:cobalt-zinc-cadmium efflux system membrane fusion protein